MLDNIKNDVIEVVEGYNNLVKNNSLISRLRIHRELNQPVLLLGRPGIGKTHSVRSLIKEGEWFADVRLAQKDPTDISGMPVINRILEDISTKTRFIEAFLQSQHLSSSEKQTAEDNLKKLYHHGLEIASMSEAEIALNFSRPEFLPPLSDWNAKGIVFFDEINTGMTINMNTVLQLIHFTKGTERMLGSHRVQPGLYFIAAGNKAEHGGHVNPISAPLLNRFYLINVEPDIAEWTEWAFENNIHRDVIGFVTFRKEMFSQNAAGEYMPFPTPRGWSEGVSPLLHAGYAGIGTFSGVVGSAADAAFNTYLVNKSMMPDMDKLLHGEIEYKFDDSNNISRGVNFAVLMELIFRMRENENLMPRAIEVAATAPPELGAVFFASLVRYITHPDRKNLLVIATRTAAMRDWTKKHASTYLKANV